MEVAAPGAAARSVVREPESRGSAEPMASQAAAAPNTLGP